MPKPSGTLKLYRTVHKDRAIDMDEATQQVIEYFTSHGYPDVHVVDSGVNPLGHFGFVCTANGTPPLKQAAVSHSKAVSGSPQVEVLTCGQCGSAFSRELSRGRKPRLCPTCAGSAGTATHADPADSRHAVVTFIPVNATPGETIKDNSEAAELDFNSLDIPGYEETDISADDTIITDIPAPSVNTETFTCTSCWNTFVRPIVRGRKPSKCDACK